MSVSGLLTVDYVLDNVAYVRESTESRLCMVNEGRKLRGVGVR